MSRRGVVLLAVCVALLAPACTRTEEGVPVAGTEAPGGVSTSVPDPGPAPAPAGAPCVPADLPPVRIQAEIADPSAPTATVGVPEGWSMASVPDGARLQGPDGMWATITIAVAQPDAEAAFETYVEDLTADAVISSVSLLPGELCGYPGQKVMGVLSDEDDGTGSVEYEARLVHVPTGGQAYLIAVYVEAPTRTAGFDEAAVMLTDDFEIGLP